MKEKKSSLKRKKFSAVNFSSMFGIGIVAVVFAIVAIVIFGLMAFYGTRNSMRVFYSNLMQDTVSRHIDFLDEYLLPHFDGVDKATQNPIIKSGDLERAAEYFRESNLQLPRSATDIFYADLSGAAVSLNGKNLDVSKEKFFARTLSGKDEYVLDFFSFSNDEYALAKCVRDDDGKINGVVWYSMMLASISAPVYGMNSEDTFYAFAFSLDNYFVIPLSMDSVLNKSPKYLSADDLHIKETLMEKMLANKRGKFLFKSKTYPYEFIVWACIDKTDWVIAVDAYGPKLDSSVDIFKKHIIIICSIFVVCAILIAIFIFVFSIKKNSSHRLTLQQEDDIDTLTGLWTESFFEESIEKLLKENPDKNYILMGLDIRGFRIVQQTEGHGVANEQLIALSRRLNQIARQKNGFAARGHTDHFYLIYPISDKDSALREFDEILYNGNFLAGRAGELVPTKTGIVFVGKNYEKDSVVNLIGKTSYAKQMVQDNLLKNYSVYDSSLESRVLQDKRIERYIPIAFSHDEFYVVYQPKVDLTSGKIIGAEALVRWSSAELGNVMPDSFISLFERNGYINRLDFYVYKKVFEFMSNRIEAKKPLVPISVNMSRFHLSDDKFVSKFYNLFKNYDIPHELIEVEILERSLGIADDRARQVAEELHENGFRIAIDDFGTGESSLSLISKIPADILKLDRKFMIEVEDATNSSEDEFMVVKQIVDMAKSIGKETICEGVETERQINFLRSINCNYVQGYFYSKPLKEEDFIKYLESHI